LNASILAQIASLTFWFQQGVLFSLPPATLNRFCPQHSTAEAMIADLNSEQWPFHLDVLRFIWKLPELCCHIGCKLLPHFFVFKCLSFYSIIAGNLRDPLLGKGLGADYQMVISW